MKPFKMITESSRGIALLVLQPRSYVGVGG
jgi:hypothetical protein